MERYELNQMQGLPLSAKIIKTQQRIKEWYEHYEGQVYISFSGGKDSTVLTHLVQDMYSDVPLVFANTGVEFPEIVQFARTFNITELRPNHPFRYILRRWGYPVVSKFVSRKVYQVKHSKSQAVVDRIMASGEGVSSTIGYLPYKWRALLDAPFECSDMCCGVMKKDPFKKYERRTKRAPIIGILAADSMKRALSYVQRGGCNVYTMKRAASWPLGFWTPSDIDSFVATNGIPICSVYEMGYQHTGCVGCTFGMTFEQPPNRYQLLKQTHPRLWSWWLDTMGFRQVLDYIKMPYE